MNKNIRFRYRDKLECMELQIFKTPEEADLLKIKETDFDAIWVCRGNVSIFNDVIDVLPHVKSIRFLAEEKQDVSWISGMKKLEFLSLHGEIKGYVDFNQLTCLKEIFIDVCKTTENLLQSNVKPNGLSLYKYKGSLTSLPTNMFEHVHTLLLSSTAMTSLDGLEKFRKINTVVLERCLKMLDISALAAHPNIKELHITGCNKIEDYQVISALTSLEEFSFGNKILPSLKLLTSKKLKSVELGTSTTVADLDIEYFENFPLLEHAIFDKRKGYAMNALELKNRRLARITKDS